MNNASKRLLKGFWRLSRVNRRSDCHRASTGKIGRETFTRTYPTLLVLPDGSTVTVRYHEPREIIKLPIDMSSLTEDEKREKLAARKPQIFIETAEEQVEDSFSLDEYSFIWKDKPKDTS